MVGSLGIFKWGLGQRGLSVPMSLFQFGPQLVTRRSTPRDLTLVIYVGSLIYNRSIVQNGGHQEIVSLVIHAVEITTPIG